MISLDELLELSPLNQFLNLLLQIMTFIGVVAMILVETIVFLWDFVCRHHQWGEVQPLLQDFWATLASLGFRGMVFAVLFLTLGIIEFFLLPFSRQPLCDESVLLVPVLLSLE